MVSQIAGYDGGWWYVALRGFEERLRLPGHICGGPVHLEDDLNIAEQWVVPASVNITRECEIGVGGAQVEWGRVRKLLSNIAEPETGKPA
jgi:hypothetical protein